MYRRRRTRRSARPVGSRQRRSRWVVVASEPVTIAPGAYQAFSLLSPIQPPSGVSDSIYQQMTKPTLIRVMGHLTIFSVAGYTCNLDVGTRFSEYAWGIYRDVDFTGSTTDLPAYSAGYSNSWMVHKTGTVALPAYTTCPDGGASTVYPLGGEPYNDLTYRRYELNLSKYKRTLDSFNDTLVLSVENSTNGNMDIAVSFYFRMLLLE